MRAITLLFLCMSIQAHADCFGHLYGVNIWESEINGQIVTKHTMVLIGDWDPNGGFGAVALSGRDSAELRRPSLQVEYWVKGKRVTTKVYKRLKRFNQNPNLKIFSDFVPARFFQFPQEGTFKLLLKDGNKVVCSESHKYMLEE